MQVEPPLPKKIKISLARKQDNDSKDDSFDNDEDQNI